MARQKPLSPPPPDGKCALVENATRNLIILASPVRFNPLTQLGEQWLLFTRAHTRCGYQGEKWLSFRYAFYGKIIESRSLRLGNLIDSPLPPPCLLATDRWRNDPVVITDIRFIQTSYEYLFHYLHPEFNLLEIINKIDVALRIIKRRNLIFFPKA